jgi:hypothetical protein
MSGESVAATRHITGSVVEVTVEPSVGSTLYAVEEHLATGFLAMEVSEGGAYDGVNRTLRWGPFFDNELRVLRYRVVEPVGFEGELALHGQLSADGDAVRIVGDSVIVFGLDPSRQGGHLEEDDHGWYLLLHGPLNSIVQVERNTQLSQTGWSLITEIVLTQVGQEWRIPDALDEESGFWRISILEP